MSWDENKATSKGFLVFWFFSIFLQNISFLFQENLLKNWVTKEATLNIDSTGIEFIVDKIFLNSFHQKVTRVLNKY